MTIDALKEYGANTQEGLGRCLNNQEFYFKMIRMALDDGGFEKLKNAVEVNDLAEAFEAAHSLKGVMGNLALTPLYTPVSEMTEQLRNRTEVDYSGYVDEIMKQKTALEKICEE